MADRDGPGGLRHTSLERLMHYFHALQTLRCERDSGWVASVEIARQLNLDDSQVRRDLGRLGVRGHPRVGFRLAEVVDAITDVMGLGQTWAAVIVGLGQLGSALASYDGFTGYGLRLVGLFDSDSRKRGKGFGELSVSVLDELPDFLGGCSVDIGIVTVPAVGAQDVADMLVAGGVRAIWNFAPVNLTVPEDVIVRNEHISVGLGEVMYLLKHLDR